MAWLDEFDAAVLFQLWKHREDGFGDHVHSRDIRNMLGPNDPKEPSRNRVVRSLDKMKEAKLVEWVDKLPERGSGPKPVGFRIASGNLMTRPSTAVMLLAVHSDPTPPTPQSALIESLLPFGFRHKGREITEDYVKEQVAFAVDKGYLIQTPSSDTADVQLAVAERLDAELTFIDKLRRCAQASRIIWKSTAKEKFDRKEESSAFTEFLVALNELTRENFGNWFSYANSQFVPVTDSEVEFKAGHTLSIIQKLKSSLTDFQH